MIVPRMELSYASLQAAAACSSFLGPNDRISATLLGFDLNPALDLVLRPWRVSDGSEARRNRLGAQLIQI